MSTSETLEKYDLIVIGGGPAGYVASIRAAQLGFRTACVEKTKTLGGTCLNIGCIPSKVLLDSSEHYHFAKTRLQKHGVGVTDVKLDLPLMMKRKEAVVRQLTNGVLGLFRKNKIDWIQAEARLLDVQGEIKKIEVLQNGQKRILEASRILLATGSEPVALPSLPYDGKRVISSTEALSLLEVPKHLVVVGAGAIGLELGSVWLRLGSKITVVEFQDRIIPGSDKQVSGELYKLLVKQGFEFRLSSKAVGLKDTGAGLILEVEDMASATRHNIEADYVLVATGRRPNTAGLGLEEAGIKKDDKGRVEINDQYQTNINNVYAVGDIVFGPMLAHKAEEEGIAAVEFLAGQKGHVNYLAIPNVVYTWPEYASVGYGEEDLKSANVDYKIGTFPFMANGRSKSMDEVEGFVKIIADSQTDRILGVHILGPRASDLIAEAVLAIEMGATAEQLARTCHAHPTLPEAVKEAAFAVNKRAIHY